MICILDENNYCTRHRKRHIGHMAKIAVDPSENGERYRKLWDGIRDVSPERTPFHTKARSYISTLSQHVLNNFAEVPAEVREQRQAICNSCDKRDPVKNACKVCGCKLEKTFLGDKLAWAVSSCPLGKWSKFDTTPLTMFGEMEKWQQAYHENPPASGGISGVENPKVSFENSMTDGNKLLLDAMRFDHENLHPQVIPGLRFNSTIIEQA